MTHLKGAVWTERLLLVLILASLAGTLNLVLAIHRRVIRSTTPSPIASDPSAARPARHRAVLWDCPDRSSSAIFPEEDDRIGPGAGGAAPKPVEDPTAPILARMDLAIAREAEAARQADRRAATLEAARKASASESERWKRREMLVRQQVAALTKRADKLERDALSVDAERDVLARERDALKAALVKGSQRSGYSILPYKGPNGTWRRPIVLECTNNSVKLQPNGPSFSMMELSPLIHPRSSPVVLAIAREMVHIQQSETPDGAPAVPYLVFLVRPDGIRPYYQARARLESLGIAFGYELVEQELAVEIPDFNDVKTWDGSVPLDMPQLAGGDAKTRPSWPATTDQPGSDRSGDSSTWPGGDRTAKSDSSTSRRLAAVAGCGWESRHRTARARPGPGGRARQAAEAADRRRPATARADPHWPRSIWVGVQGEATGRRRVSRADRATGLPTISSGRPAPATRLPRAVGATVAQGAGRRMTPGWGTDSRDRRARASSLGVRPRRPVGPGRICPAEGPTLRVESR